MKLEYVIGQVFSSICNTLDQKLELLLNLLVDDLCGPVVEEAGPRTMVRLRKAQLFWRNVEYKGEQVDEKRQLWDYERYHLETC